VLTASGSASKKPSAPEGQKPAVGRAAAAPITEVDYTDIPNTQIRRVKSLFLSNCENSNLKEHWWIQLLVSRLSVVPKHPDGVQLLNLNVLGDVLLCRSQLSGSFCPNKQYHITI
jgi:hypothetical protein